MMDHREQPLIDQRAVFQHGFNPELVFDGVRPSGYTPQLQDFSS